MRYANAAENVIYVLFAVLATVLAAAMMCSCELQTLPHRTERDPCCDLHGGTCAWLGAKVVPICCDGYFAEECRQPLAGGGAS